MKSFPTMAPTILVIDDSALDRLLLSAVLQKEGFIVFTANDGKEGLQQAKQKQPDIILLDVFMPDESGFETCKKLKQDGSTNTIPVIFLSGAEDLKSRVTGLTSGGVDYITKPFEREEVLARIRVHLRIRRAFQALIAHQKEQLKQLEIAQQSILVLPEEFVEAHFAVYYRALHAAGGDFYDVVSLGDGIVGYFTADVGGHDLGAAYITSALKALLRQNFSLLYSPLETMTLLNSVLSSVLSEGVVLSACCMRLNRRTGQLILVSAGHPPLIRIPAQGAAEMVSAEGDLLGAFELPYFQSREIHVLVGDRLLLFSDGLIETYQGKPITRREGLQRIMDIAAELRSVNLAEMVEQTALTICPAAEKNSDDILLLGVEL